MPQSIGAAIRARSPPASRSGAFRAVVPTVPENTIAAMRYAVKGVGVAIHRPWAGVADLSGSPPVSPIRPGQPRFTWTLSAQRSAGLANDRRSSAIRDALWRDSRCRTGIFLGGAWTAAVVRSTSRGSAHRSSAPPDRAMAPAAARLIVRTELRVGALSVCGVERARGVDRGMETQEHGHL